MIFARSLLIATLASLACLQAEDVHFTLALLPHDFWLSSIPTLAVVALVPPGADEITVTLATSALGQQAVVTRQAGELCRINLLPGPFNGGLQAACFQPWAPIDAPTVEPAFDYVTVEVRRGAVTSSKKVTAPQPGSYY